MVYRMGKDIAGTICYYTFTLMIYDTKKGDLWSDTDNRLYETDVLATTAGIRYRLNYEAQLCDDIHECGGDYVADNFMMKLKVHRYYH